MREPLDLNPLDVKEQQLNSKHLQIGGSPCPVRKSDPATPQRKHISAVCIRNLTLADYPQVVTIGKGKNRDQPAPHL